MSGLDWVKLLVLVVFGVLIMVAIWKDERVSGQTITVMDAHPGCNCARCKHVRRQRATSRQDERLVLLTLDDVGEPIGHLYDAAPLVSDLQRVARCSNCGLVVAYPGSVCPQCDTHEPRWQAGRFVPDSGPSG